MRQAEYPPSNRHSLLLLPPFSAHGFTIELDAIQVDIREATRIVDVVERIRS